MRHLSLLHIIAGVSFAGILLVLALTGCDRGVSQNASTAQPIPLQTVDVQLGSRVFTLEIADENHERQRGLMYRQEMAENHGMIFVFGEDDERSFWMRNTFIPLDLIFVNSAGRVVSVKGLKPLDETPVDSQGSARFAIELTSGAAAKAGIVPGMMVKIPARAQAAVN